MKKMLTAVLLAGSFCVVHAEESAAPDTTAPVAAKNAQKPKLTPEKVKYLQMKHTGGPILDTRCQRGSVVIVNAQSAADTALFDDVIKDLSNFARFKYEVKPGTFSLANPTVVGSASVFVVDDPALPMSLVAPESKWVMVNVAPLKTEKQAFFNARVKKATVRALAYLLGAANSQYPMCLTGCVTKAEDYDQFVALSLPVDVLGKFEKYAYGYGLTPAKRTTYKAAAQEGWAPAPTNEFQKAIWDQVHQVPTNGIEIKFDPKKGK